MARLITRWSTALVAVLMAASPGLAFEAPEEAATTPTAEAEPAPATEAAQDLDLFAVLDVFKESQNVEDFETRLNDPDAGVVNLDLNGDEEVDFLGVFEEVDGEVHVLILRAFISADESQDIASIELERIGEDVTVQVVGDPGIYGPDYIIEPDLGEEASLSTQIAMQPAIEPIVIASADGSWWPRFSRAESDGSFDLAAVVVVRTWPTVTVIYTTGYRHYHSPYRWHRYPAHYRARRPAARHHYRNHTAHHRKHHRQTTHRRSNGASNVYKKNSVSSSKVPKATPASGSRAQTKSASPGTSPSHKPTTTQKAPSQRKSPSNTGPSNSGRSPSGGNRGRAAPSRRR
jgi:hypothetical protein